MPPKRGKAKQQSFPAGSIVIRMDQPYSRVADALLDRQFWAPEDPQKHPYDDTGWTFTDLFNVKVARVTDPAILNAEMKPVDDPQVVGQDDGTGSIIREQHRPEFAALAGLQDERRQDPVCGKGIRSRGQSFGRGIATDQRGRDETAGALNDLALDGTKSPPRHLWQSTLAAPRIAFMHTWLSTQTEGWWRYAFDSAGIPTSTSARKRSRRRMICARSTT